MIAAILVKAGLERSGLPALVGYIAIGLLLHSVDQRWLLFSEGERGILDFLANIGIISLLFRVGLESKLQDLIHQLRRASIVWLGNVAVSGVLGFGVSYSLLNLDLIPSLFIGTAMTATSVGVSVGLWREAGAIQSVNGDLMLDVAEMDDISAVVMMSFLFSTVPILRDNPDASLLPILGQTSISFCLKATLFGGGCFLFSRYAERPLTRFFQRIEPPPDPTIMVAGIGFITATLAGLLGFSVAIGAFFAGLVFSRDPQAVKLDTSFDTFYELFVPFFFIGVGLKLDLSSLLSSLGLGVLLLLVAIAGKMVGVIVPVLALSDRVSAILIGVSMVPRAEIMMIIMQYGLQLGEWAVSPQIFSAMTFVSIATTLGVPLILRPLLRRWPQTNQNSLPE